MEEERFMQIPALALNISSRLRLAYFLDPDDPLCSELPIDYKGLAYLMKFENLDIRNFETNGKRTLGILEEWEKRADATIGQLLIFLKEMGRYDVIQDIMPRIEKDAEAFLKKMSKFQESPLQVPEVTSCRKNDFQVRNDVDALTCDDVRTGECTFYDAYLCYADENEDDALALAEKLEQLGFRLFIRSRDSLSGQEELISNIHLIKERCRRMLIILSPEFPRSQACKFQIGFASSLAIEQRERILIPVVVSPVNNIEIPLIIRYISKIDFTKQDIHMWAWKRLICSLGTSQEHINSTFLSELERNPFRANTHMMSFISAPARPSVEFPSNQSYVTNFNSAPSNPCIEFPPSQSDIAALNNNVSAEFHTASVAVSYNNPSTSIANHSNVCMAHENRPQINPINVAKAAVSSSIVYNDPSASATNHSNVCMSYENRSPINSINVAKAAVSSSSIHTRNKISKPSSFDTIFRNLFKGKKNSSKPSMHFKGQLSSSSVSSSSNATSGFFSHNTFDTESIDGFAKDCSLNTHT